MPAICWSAFGSKTFSGRPEVLKVAGVDSVPSEDIDVISEGVMV